MRALLLAALVFYSLSGSGQNGRDRARSLIWTANWSPNDKYIALGGDDSLLWIYDADNFRLHKTIPMGNMIRSLAWHPNNKLLLVSTRDRTHILNVETGTVIPLSDKGGARGIGWNRDGSLAATAGSEVRIWSMQGQLIRTIKKENNNSYLSLDWHPSKNIILTGGDEIRIVDTSGKQLQLIRHRKEYTGVLTVKWHPSGQFFASGDYGHHNEGIESLIQFWQTDGKLIKTLHGSKAEYRNISWNADGSMLASASDALRTWARDGSLLNTSTEQEGNLWGIDWNSKGSLIVTTSGHGKFKLWTREGKLLKEID